MSRRAVRSALTVAVAVAAASVLVSPAFATVTAGSASPGVRLHTQPKLSASAPPGTNAGPPYTFTTELMFGTPNLALKDRAILTRTSLGYRYWSGQQDSHLTITVSNGMLKFRDTGTKYFYKKLAAQCVKQRVKVGISALCAIPTTIDASQPLLIEDWPRLGNDYLDSSTLPAQFSVTMLGDKGNDVAKFGAGRDFFNGYLGRDRVYGGGGNDWIRGGGGNDLIDGGAGDDDIVSTQNDDTVFGGSGNDRIWGGPGGDDLIGGSGADLLVCGAGVDTSKADFSDQVSRDCENNKTVARQGTSPRR